MKRYVSPQPLEIPAFKDLDELSRADLVFHGVSHAGPSYEARVFIDNPKASTKTPRTDKAGYAGSYVIFGHAGCAGEAGHCHPAYGTSDDFDRRAPHPLTPYTRTVTVTDAIKRALKASGAGKVNVTVVPIVAPPRWPRPDMPEAFEFTEMRLVTYEED